MYNNFLFPETAETRAGFKYRLLGRIHLFQISNIGIYCRSLIEKETYDVLSQIVEEREDVRFWIPADDESIGAIIDVAGKSKKILLLFRNKNDERVIFDENMYDPLVIGLNEPLTKDRFYEIITRIK